MLRLSDLVMDRKRFHNLPRACRGYVYQDYNIMEVEIQYM